MDDECLQWWWQQVKRPCAWVVQKAKRGWAWLLQRAQIGWFSLGIAILVWGFWFVWTDAEQRAAGATMMQAGAAMMALGVALLMPRIEKKQRERAQLMRTLAIAKIFFSDFDEMKEYFSNGAPHLNQHYSAPRNWGFFHDAFRNLSKTGDASSEAQVLVDTLYQAAFGLFMGYGSLQFKHGLMAVSTEPLYREYVRCKDSVEEARERYESLMKKAHPSLSPREPKNASEPPPSSSSQPSSSA